jgi:LPS export ABC transporter protein LptC
VRIRIFLLLIPLLLLVAAPLWWPAAAAFLRPRGGIEAGPARCADTRQFAMAGVRFSQSRSGRPEWRIDAARLETVSGRDHEMQLEEVEAVLHGKSGGKGGFHITSDKGVYDSETLVLTLIDNVLVRMGSGYEMRTEVLRYLEKTALMETRAPVRLVGEDLIVRGRGMTYDLKTGSYVIGGRLNVEMK